MMPSQLVGETTTDVELSTDANRSSVLSKRKCGTIADVYDGDCVAVSRVRDCVTEGVRDVVCDAVTVDDCDGERVCDNVRVSVGVCERDWVCVRDGVT